MQSMMGLAAMALGVIAAAAIPAGMAVAPLKMSRFPRRVGHPIVIARMDTGAGRPMIERDPQAAAEALRAVADVSPKVAVVLGSGLGAVAEVVADAVEVPFRDIPGMPAATVPGHAGRVLLGEISGLPAMVLSGRVHLYEGWQPAAVTFGVDVAGELGVETVVVTGAAGGVNPDFAVGQVMMIRDHINLLGSNPLSGPILADKPIPFVPMSRAYSEELLDKALEIGRDAGLDVTSGVYLATLGPSFETAAEIRMHRTLGADAVGMSTVPEVIRATWLGMETVGISTITNMATGLATKEHDHDEVARIAAATAPAVATIVAGLCDHLR